MNSPPLTGNLGSSLTPLYEKGKHFLAFTACYMHELRNEHGCLIGDIISVDNDESGIKLRYASHTDGDPTIVKVDGASAPIKRLRRECTKFGCWNAIAGAELRLVELVIKAEQNLSRSLFSKLLGRSIDAPTLMFISRIHPEAGYVVLIEDKCPVCYAGFYFKGNNVNNEHYVEVEDELHYPITYCMYVPRKPFGMKTSVWCYDHSAEMDHRGMTKDMFSHESNQWDHVHYHRYEPTFRGYKFLHFNELTALELDILLCAKTALSTLIDCKDGGSLIRKRFVPFPLPFSKVMMTVKPDVWRIICTMMWCLSTLYLPSEVVNLKTLSALQIPDSYTNALSNDIVITNHKCNVRARGYTLSYSNTLIKWPISNEALPP